MPASFISTVEDNVLAVRVGCSSVVHLIKLVDSKPRSTVAEITSNLSSHFKGWIVLDFIGTELELPRLDKTLRIINLRQSWTIARPLIVCFHPLPAIACATVEDNVLAVCVGCSSVVHLIKLVDSKPRSTVAEITSNLSSHFKGWIAGGRLIRNRWLDRHRRLNRN